MEYKTITAEDFENMLKADGITVDEVPRLVIARLRDHGMRLAAAESCTGGLISKLITDVSGASEVFDCGVCSYANEIKERLLGVSHETLQAFGAVSSDTAIQMARGVMRLAGADIGISTTGIAGPTGGSPDKPVGTVFIGLASKSTDVVYKADLTAKNDSRDKIRQHSASLALYCVLSVFKPFSA